jgi:aminoglycoside 6'-N-acetyltransferase
MADYLIRPVDEADLGLIRAWRERPHVTQWWGEPDVEPEAEKLADPNIDLWLVAHEGRPFAFIQDYRVHAWDPHPFRYLAEGARGLDLFIGEADMLGLRHGQRFLRQHVDAMFARGVPAAGADPHPENLRARRAYEKAGFTLASGPVDTRWGHAVLMHRHAPEAPAQPS